jgi:hypothetical protein
MLMLNVDEPPLPPRELGKIGQRRDQWSETETSQRKEFYWACARGLH